MKRIGLVFSGGGGKGAYEIGVWKYLHEKGIDRHVKAVSGTSVGALNAALFAGGTYEKAEHIWKNISPDMVLAKISDFKIKEKIRQKVNYSTASSAAFLLGFNWQVIPYAELYEAIITYLLTNGFFSKEGISALIKEGVNMPKLLKGDVSCFATCIELPFSPKLTYVPFLIPQLLYRLNLLWKKTRHYFRLKDHCEESIIEILRASSAIPFVFPEVTIEGKAYVDGGFSEKGDNVPIQPIYDMGIKKIIVIHLNQDDKISDSQYPKANITHIIPSEDLGGLIGGTLDFTAKGAQKRMEIGYKDAKNILEPIIGSL